MGLDKEPQRMAGGSKTGWRALAMFVSLLAGSSLSTTAAYPAYIPGFESEHRALWLALFWLGVVMFALPVVVATLVYLMRRPLHGRRKDPG